MKKKEFQKGFFFKNFATKLTLGSGETNEKKSYFADKQQEVDITSLRAGQEVSPVGRSGSGSAGIGSAILSKDGASVVDRASINTSISSGNRHIHGHGHHAANLSRLVM